MNDQEPFDLKIKITKIYSKSLKKKYKKNLLTNESEKFSDSNQIDNK